MKLKLDADGHVVVQDGKPVYVHDDGKETPYDVPDMYAKLSKDGRTNSELRTQLQAAQDKLNAIGEVDIAAARKALETVKNLDDKKLVDAGQVEAVKAEVTKVYEQRLAESNKRAEDLGLQLHGEIVGGAFARSKFLADKTVLPPDLAQSAFGKNFRIEEGKLRAFDNDGNAIFSRVKPGSPAEFDEAIEIVVDQYPRKESILRADNGSGGGAPGNPGGKPGGKTLNRAAFDALDPIAKGEFVKTGTVTD